MRKPSEGTVALGALAVFAFWLFVVLPFVFSSQNGPTNDHATNKCSAEESKNHGFWERADCDPVAYFTLWLVGFTGVLAFSTIGLMFFTWRGVRNQTRDTEILQRAYISAEPGGLVPHHDRGDRLMCAVTFHNVGHLPARNVRWYGAVWPNGLLAEYAPPEDPEFDPGSDDGFPIGDLVEGNIVLPPGAKTTRHVATMFTYRFANVAYVWGIVTYDDGFGRSRYTKFCHRYGLKLFIGQMSFTIPGDRAFLHEFGNDAD